MGALANVITPRVSERSRKQPATARTAAGVCRPREWKDLDAETRAGTDYKKMVGWVPLYHAMLADLVRLSSGAACYGLVLLVLQNLGRNHEGGRPAAETRPLDVGELASLLSCDERTINRELAYLVERSMALVARLAGGKVVVSLRFTEWPQIEQSYKAWADAKREMLDEQAEEASEDEEEAKPVKAGAVSLTPKPVVVRGGCASRSIPVNTGVSGLKFEWKHSPLDFEFSAVVHSGELIVSGWLPEQKAKTKSLRSNSNAKRTESTGYTETVGHTCPENALPVPANGGIKGQSKPAAAVHPRGEELAKLFDPLIFRYCHKTLSGDSSSFLQACAAIADTPHDFLVAAAVERGSRPISRPSVVVKICQEIYHNWTAGKAMPAEPRGIPSRAEILAIIERENVELEAKRAAMRRKAVR